MNETEVKLISIDDIFPNRNQPRINFDGNDLNELANSIKYHGIIQPLILRKLGDKYEIIAGERRYRAALLAGLKTVPAILMEKTDNESAEIAIIENIQRKDLNPIEEALAYKKLLNKGLTQEEIAKKIGISQAAVANKLRLLNLTKEVQDAILNTKISERHGRSLLKLEDSDKQINLLNKIISEKLTVKETEKEINSLINVEKEPQREVIEEISPSNEETTTEDFNYEEFKLDNEIANTNEEDEDIPMILPLNDDNENIDTFEMEPIEEVYSFSEDLDNDELIGEKNIEEIMNNSKKYEYLDSVDKTRDFIEGLKLQGVKLRVEEHDMDKEYQIIIKIEK